MSSPTVEEQVTQLAEMLRASESALVFTGAGISTASGIPDYRGPHGVWKMETPVMYQDFMTSAEARRRYWDQKASAGAAFGAAAPSATHRALVDLENAGKLRAVVTQNVDGLHAAAGTSPDALVELHGTVRAVECQTCGDRTDPQGHFTAFVRTGEPPACRCGGYLKPATISFGQQLRPGDLFRAQAAAETADLVLALGSTLSVTPAASVPLIAAERGTPYVIVNRGATDHDRFPQLTLRIDGDVDDIVPGAVLLALG
jgi:NAD-dependent deacetylase